MHTISAHALQAVTRLVARRMGSTDAEAAEVADHLVRANLAGHDSHGVGMLPRYVQLLRDGLLVPNQTPLTVLDSGALLVIDARRGYGPRMAADAVRRAIGRAQELGACVLALRNSSHIGRIGTYAELASAAGCAFTAFVNVADHHNIQTTWQAAEPRLGTNPFCAAVPGADGPAVLLDMATTTIAAGKARVAYNKGVPVPDGCLIDAAGNPTNDPAGFIRDHTGALKAFGMHKGSGLAVMCEVMAAVAGGQGAFHTARGGILNSMLATVIDLSKLGDPAAIARGVESVKAHVKSACPAPGYDEVLVPGEPERRAAAKRMQQGIEVDDITWREIRAAAESLGITAAEFDQAAGADYSKLQVG
ncbi:malate/lactate/ureidoglycolate dehydrogenase [Rhodopila globiformis]|uniref:Malate/lactate/ureidoglycolate dehydrogenase n=1 Tax=Rhodopila globiformis TaxID=1071 RepID=A0A2S6MZW1_RHOGL|nr:malate/lactate/ureidoglycolate dehydrogenase [Rhodopila globiformis]PPQ27876.1 malate/lactate/ureidoglycolate dehydrogenase [Rhodopila globiformis]